MPAAKHSSPLSPARIIFLAAVVVLVGLVVWVAVRAVGPSRDEAAQPTVVIPTVPVATPLPSSPPPSPVPSSASPSLSRSPSPSSSRRSSSPTPSSSRASSSPSPSRHSASPSPVSLFSATVTVSASWDQGYVAMVQVVNKGTKAATWSVTVSHRGLSGLRLGGTWNAQGRQSGSTFVFTGGPLAAGQTASFGYQAGKQGSGKARPSGCSVSGGSCHVS